MAATWVVSCELTRNGLQTSLSQAAAVKCLKSISERS
jgi:hypothetical protein